MDKAGLEQNLGHLERVLAGLVPKEYFEPLKEDVTDWRAWNKLYNASIAFGYTGLEKYHRGINLAFECARAASRLYLGDIA